MATATTTATASKTTRTRTNDDAARTDTIEWATQILLSRYDIQAVDDKERRKIARKTATQYAKDPSHRVDDTTKLHWWLRGWIK